MTISMTGLQRVQLLGIISNWRAKDDEELSCLQDIKEKIDLEPTVVAGLVGIQPNGQQVVNLRLVRTLPLLEVDFDKAEVRKLNTVLSGTMSTTGFTVDDIEWLRPLQTALAAVK